MRLIIRTIRIKTRILTILAAGILSIPFHPALAQGITMEETLAYVNDKVGPAVEVDVARGSIVAKYFKDGEMYREDKVLCKRLDHSEIDYDISNRIFYVNCQGNALCVDRQLYQRKIRREYVRISFPVDLSGAEIEGMKKALKHMIRLVTEKRYENDEPFE